MKPSLSLDATISINHPFDILCKAWTIHLAALRNLRECGTEIQCTCSSALRVLTDLMMRKSKLCLKTGEKTLTRMKQAVISELIMFPLDRGKEER
jgi:hypothetical protein